MTDETQEEAITAWNTRTTDEENTRLREYLGEAIEEKARALLKGEK